MNYKKYNDFKSFNHLIRGVYVCKSGDSMTGNLNMNCNDISSIKNIQFCSDGKINGDVEFTDNVTIKGDLDICGNILFVDLSVNNLEVLNNLIVDGNSQFNNDVDISGNLSVNCNLINDVSGINFCDGTYIGQGNSFDISSNEVIKFNQDNLVIDTCGNIGIGTTTPTKMLDVSGDTIIRGELVIEGSVLKEDNLTVLGDSKLSNLFSNDAQKVADLSAGVMDFTNPPQINGEPLSLDASANIVYTDTIPADLSGNDFFLYQDENKVAKLLKEDPSDLFRQPPAIQNYTGNVYSTSSETTLRDILGGNLPSNNIQNGDIVELLADISLTTPIEINVNIELRGDTRERKLTCSADKTIDILGDGCLIRQLTIENTNTTSVASAIVIGSFASINTKIKDCNIVTNEFGVSCEADAFKIYDCSFSFVGTPDSHRYILLSRCVGETYIVNCDFEGNTISSTQGLIINSGTAGAYDGGKLHIYECRGGTVANPVQRIGICESDLTGAGFELWMKDNDFLTSSGYFIFYGPTALEGVSTIGLLNNIETSVDVNDGKGLIGLDSFAPTGDLPLPILYARGNQPASLRSDYPSYSAVTGLVAYKDTIFSPSQTLELSYDFRFATEGGGFALTDLQMNSQKITFTDGKISILGAGDEPIGKGDFSVAIGRSAGFENQGDNATAVGRGAGAINQSNNATAIGRNAGFQNQEDFSTAVGAFAGQVGQRTFSTAVGRTAGFQNQGENAVAVGRSAGFQNQGDNATAVGRGAGAENQSNNATAIGREAGETNQGENAVAIGNYAGYSNQHANSIVLNATGGNLNSVTTDALYVKPVRNATTTDALYYDASSGEVSYGAVSGGGGGWEGDATSDLSMNDFSITFNDEKVRIGTDAGATGQDDRAIAIGQNAGYSNQGIASIAIGVNAGLLNQKNRSVAIGQDAGSTNQGVNCVAIGSSAGQADQHDNTIVLNGSGNTVNTDISNALYVKPVRNATTTDALYYDTTSGEITYGATGGWEGDATSDLSMNDFSITFNDEKVRIGTDAGVSNQGQSAVAIGYNAGNFEQGDSSIAIGSLAGQTNQHDNTIVLNATDVSLNTDISNALFIAPIRGVAHGLGIGVLKYDPITNEVTYSTTNPPVE